MLGFSPLASAPLSATSEELQATTVAFEADDILSSAPVIDIVTIFEEETVPISDITLGAPTIGAVTALYTDVLSVDEVTLGAVVVDTAPVFEDETVTVDDVVTGTPVVDGATPVYTDVLFADDITSGAPVIDGATPQYTDVLAADEITLGVPTVDTAPVFERETCDVNEVTLGAPSVEAAAVSVISNFFPQDVVTRPVVDTLPFFQEYILAADDITSGAPTFAVRFTWDFQELQSDIWREDNPDAFPVDLEFPPNSALRIALAKASVGEQPEEDLFVNTIVGGRSLGSVYDGAVGAVNGVSDALEMQRYIQGSSLTSQASIDYIENFMLPYMAANPDLYSAYYTGNATSSRIPNWSEQSESASTWYEQDVYPKASNGVYTLPLALLQAFAKIEPQQTLFKTAEAISGRPLGDIGGNGLLGFGDYSDINQYIYGILTDQAKIDYIENYMLPYMAARPDDYKIYYNATTESSAPSWTGASESVKVWTNAA